MCEGILANFVGFCPNTKWASQSLSVSEKTGGFPDRLYDVDRKCSASRLEAAASPSSNVFFMLSLLGKSPRVIKPLSVAWLPLRLVHMRRREDTSPPAPSLWATTCTCNPFQKLQGMIPGPRNAESISCGNRQHTLLFQFQVN